MCMIFVSTLWGHNLHIGTPKHVLIVIERMKGYTEHHHYLSKYVGFDPNGAQGKGSCLKIKKVLTDINGSFLLQVKLRFT